MKKIKILLLSLSILFTFNILAAELDIRYSDMKISGSNLIFDIEIKSNDANTYLGGLDLYMNYNILAFGSMIAPAGITVTQVGFLAGAGYTTTVANSTPSRILINTFKFSPTFVNVPTVYSKVFNVSIPILSVSELAGINFQCADMQGTQFYYTGAGGGGLTTYSPVNCINDLLTLPLDPNVDLMFSEIGDPSNTTTNFVEIYNAGAASVDFTNHYEWYLSVNGSSSVLLTGTLAAGAKYTIAYNSTDFTPSLVSTIVGTGGTSQYLLSTYGDYVDGTSIDVYDGSGTGIDFTGKHAVRHYNIVSPNTTFTAAEWVVSAAQDIDMTAGSHRTTLNWSGATAAWRNQGNWTEGFIPDAGHNVAIPNSGITPMISNGMNAYSHNLTIGTAGLIIESDMTNGDGSLITYGTVTGTASVQRFLEADRYWYVTQPVTAATANVFLHCWLFTYDEPSSSWDEFIEEPSTPLNLMKGYAVWTSSINPWHQGWDPVGDTTTSYDGTLNTGDISTALTKGGNGWNFVGNPFPSAVDWDANGWTKTNLTTNAFYVWDDGSYATYTPGGGGANTATQYIPAAQGFFVNASAAGTLGVSNAVRTHNAQAFWKDSENMLNRLSIFMTDGNINDETVIYFNEDATTDLDYDFDAIKYMATASPQAYTMLGNERMAINTFNNSTQTTNVKLGVNVPEAGEFTLTASNIESFDANTPIYLEDLATGQITNLREHSSYVFSAQPGTTERFLVHFTAVQGIGDDPKADVNSIYAIDRQVYVDFTGSNGVISIYNILGQQISITEASNGLNILAVPQGNAVYIVKVISDNATVTKKVFVK